MIHNRSQNDRVSVRRHFLNFMCGLAGAILIVGCSSSPVELVGDEEEANTLVAEALDAWKAGQKPDALQASQPALHIADEDWRAGNVLKAYEVAKNPQAAGSHWRVSAVLTLSADGQPETTKNVAYAVTMEPAITILRADYLPE
jgi:hypothetical protein